MNKTTQQNHTHTYFFYQIPRHILVIILVDTLVYTIYKGHKAAVPEQN